MKQPYKQKRLALLSILIAIGATTAMDIYGYGMFSAFILIPISLAHYFVNKPSKLELGLKWGKSSTYLIAIAYPLIITSLTILVAIVFLDEAIRLSNGKSVYINLIAGIVIGPVAVLITEEGFFRGWLWATLKKAGLKDNRVLVITTLAFVVWHISAVTTGGSYGLPSQQVPVYLINVIFLSLIWGHLRAMTDSVIVPTICHAFWNAIIYALFGFGENVGALGFEQTTLLGPEIGYLGIILNGLFYLGLKKRYPLS